MVGGVGWTCVRLCISVYLSVRLCPCSYAFVHSYLRTYINLDINMHRHICISPCIRLEKQHASKLRVAEIRARVTAEDVLVEDIDRCRRDCDCDALLKR